uniref:Otogelin-like protein n=1 Tax=Sinocyclocheilus anshuiensis TaxID=1608454 RepID=A0A671KKB5_9TELE
MALDYRCAGNRLLVTKSSFFCIGDFCLFFVSVPNHGQDRDGICRSWGQHHFETFDGMYYYFPGTCSYILAKDCHSTEPQYTVWVHNSRSCRASVYSCPRGLTLFFPNEEEIYISGYQYKNVFIERLADYILVKSTFGFSLAWDGSSGVYLKMTEAHKGRPCGLCGNYNDDGSDDLSSSLSEDIADFGNSWAVDLPQERPCPEVDDDFPGPCSSESDMDVRFHDAIEKCSALLFFPFISCHENIDPNPFVASCVSDMCVSDDEETFCRTLVEYTRACSHVGYPVREWRDSFPTCADGCEDSFVHRDCISCCPPTCTFEKECLGTNLHCLDGCYCPDGLILQNGTCIAVSQCPCVYHGTAYPLGHVLEQGCTVCVCMGGVWNCTENNCTAECTVMGDAHVTTFDGRIFMHMGSCQYVLVKSRGSTKFTVTLQYRACGESQEHSCIHSVALVVDEDVSRQVTLTREGEIVIGANMVNVRRLTSMFVGLRSVFGLRFQYDWQGGRIYLQLDSTWMGSTLGLCGTLNGNLRDDFLSPAGMIEGTPQLHVNAWKVSSACLSPVNIPIIDPCEMNQQNVFYAARCDVLLEEVFAPCHAYVSPSMYHQQCRYQACRCGSACLCAALSHYAYICNKHHVTINFRAHVSECGMVCLGGMMYHPCTSACGRTCQSISSGEVCDGDCAEGCSCTEGTFYDHARQRCVLLSQCHCYFMGSVFQPGEVSFSSSGPCLCRNGRMECVSEEREPERGDCPNGKVYYSCRGQSGRGPSGMGVACELTCRNLMLNLTCPPMTPCVPGCGCPAGLVAHNGECYYPENCPCAWLGLEYLPGESVDTPCYRCVCHRGFFNCTYSPCPAVCTIYSDRHYHTFDGLEYDYVSDCQVYLVKVLPECFQLWGAGYYTVVHFPAQDLTILWDRKTTVHIRAGPQWKGQMSGLCGNFDMVTVNDMTTAGHMEVSNTQAFGDSWAVGQCESDFVVRRLCEGDLSRQPYAKRECGLLYSDVFAPCHNVVDVTWFYKNCLTDTCNCNRGGDCECLCTSIAAYAHKCCQNGVTVNWRSPTVCREYKHTHNELGEGPFTLSSAEQNDSVCVFGANVSSGEVFPLLRTNAQPSTIFHFMITTGLYKDRASRLPVVSLESAERPNYFLCVTGNRRLRLEHWQPGEEFRRKATFIHHQGLWLPGRSSFELHSQKGVFLTLSHTHARAQNYDHSYTFKISSSFIIEESSFVIPYRLICEWKYHACASPCVKTCNDPDATRCQFLPLVEGCFPRCPKSMLLDEVTRRCVYKEDCTTATPTTEPITTLFTTLSTSTTEPPYSLRVDECSEYICFNGQLMLHNSSQHCRYNISQPQCNLLGTPIQTNTDPCCPLWQCPCRCSIISDLRVITFDGNNVALYDIGSYILVHLPREKIVGHIEKCPTRNMRSSIYTPSGGTSGLCFKKLNITTQSYRIMVNRLDRKVSVNQITARLPLTRQNLNIDDTGTMYIINTPGGINIKWYHSTGIMVLQYTAPDNTSTRGLCGCCDGNPADDLRLPNGTVVRDVEDIPVFLHGWMVDTSEDTDYFRRVGDNCTTGNCSKCFTMLNQRPFSKCHHKVSPEHFCDKIWAGDLHYKEHECDFLAAYVAICYTHQICFSWRKSNFCRESLKCPPGKEYKACVNTCKTRTCQNRDYYEESTCSSIREECVCKSGTILHRADSAFCVTEDQCVCTDNDGAPRAPGEVWNGSLRGCCLFKCLENGSVVPVEPECSYEPAPLCEREGEYAVDVLEEGVCCPKKICGINTHGCIQILPSCENGDKLVIGYSALSCCPEYRCECDPLACQSVPAPTQVYIILIICICFAVCESCIEPIPVCLPGEILAVDVNTTNHCCPQYHCVCDMSLCPEPSVSCAPGAVLVVEEPDPDGPCGCPLYHCSKTQTNTHTLQMPHYSIKLKRVYVSLCVCVCVEKADVCLFQGVTILNPGQSMVQYFERELCYIVQCLTHKDPSTGFYAMEVTTANCSEKCEPHQVYVPSSDPHVCCGSCKNISCSYPSENGTTEVFMAGSSWVANCTRFDCMETAVGAVVLASGVVCPPFNDTECIQNGGVVQTYVDGCCKTCKEDGKTCKRVAIRTTIRKDDCRSNAPVTVYSCDGKCPSATIFNFNINSHARFCKCCRENGLQNRIIQLYCTRNATTVDYYYQEPMDCSCQWN